MNGLRQGHKTTFDYQHMVIGADGNPVEIRIDEQVGDQQSEVSCFKFTAPEGLLAAAIERRMGYVRKRLTQQGFTIIPASPPNDNVVIASLTGYMPADRENRIKRVRELAQQQRVVMTRLN